MVLLKGQMQNWRMFTSLWKQCSIVTLHDLKNMKAYILILFVYQS